MADADTKTCTRCGVAKPLAEFYKQKDCLHGRHPCCKVCFKAGVVAYQRANPEKVAKWGKTRRARYPERQLERQRNWATGPGRAKALAKSKRWKERNKEQQAAYRAAYRKANAELIRQRRAANYDPERKRATRKPEQNRRDRERRRARMLNAFVADVDFNTILQRDSGICGICQRPIMENTIELDHILPLAAGGTHEPDNAQIAHRACNRRKAAKADFTLTDAA